MAAASLITAAPFFCSQSHLSSRLQAGDTVIITSSCRPSSVFAQTTSSPAPRAGFQAAATDSTRTDTCAGVYTNMSYEPHSLGSRPRLDSPDSLNFHSTTEKHKQQEQR
uniref:Uncharacterized protein n=1 Tax=Knipowitschia caucasica TaxID=637954 RepID=A0AAV2LQF1_KNICA